MKAKRILFRADASERIGSGHVMRCMTFASALRETGAECVFLAATMPESLAERILAAGHEVILLAGTAPAGDRDAEALLSKAEQARDSTQCLRIAESQAFDWVVVDHYGLDRNWERAMRASIPNIMVIDDLANRAHDCDLLLDQNLGRKPLDYDYLVPPSTTILTGPRYALLRPEFATARPAALKRRNATLSHLLISLGGSDPQNVTLKILRILNEMELPEGVRISVVIGALANALEEIRTFAATMRYPTEILVDVRDMAALMSDCDLAIGAAGATAWERCCLCLPSIVLVLAENQRPGAEALANEGLAFLVNMESEGIFSSELISAIETYHHGGCGVFVERLVHKGIDGNGCTLVIREFTRIGDFRQNTQLRHLEAADLDVVLEWRNNDIIRRHMLSQDVIEHSAHLSWFEAAASSPDRRLMLLEMDGIPSGFVQFQINWNHSTATWGFYKAPFASKGTGRILGKLALEYAFERLELHKIWAEVISGNDASAKMHSALGFRQEGLMRQAYKIAGQHVDVAYYGLLRQEWKRRE